MQNKIKNFFKNITWVYTTPPNNFLTGIPSVVKFLFWVLYIKRTKKYVLGDYFGMHFLYYTKSGECAAMYTNKWIEYDLQRFILFWLKKGSLMLDVGSNVGSYSLLAASTGATVHSFEPNRKVLGIEKSNVILNDLEDQVFMHNIVLSDTAGKLSFYIKKDSLVSSLIYDKKDPGRKVTVESKTLDMFVKENKIKHIALLKVDVEGAEDKVFAGADETLKGDIVDALYWETNWKASKKDRMTLTKKLSSYGFQHFAIDIRGSQTILRKWKYGDANCLSVKKPMVNKIKKFNTFYK